MIFIQNGVINPEEYHEKITKLSGYVKGKNKSFLFYKI